MQDKLEVYISLPGGRFPLDNTGKGEDISPEIRLKNLSGEAVTLAVTLEDISHPIKNFTHWVIWDLPAKDVTEKCISRGGRLSDGSVQGLGYGMHRYAGPKPPKGKTHSYKLTVYSLDCCLELSPMNTKSAFLKKAKGHILQIGSITGDFE